MKIGKTYIEFISEKKSKKKSPAAQIKKLTKKQKTLIDKSKDIKDEVSKLAADKDKNPEDKLTSLLLKNKINQTEIDGQKIAIQKQQIALNSKIKGVKKKKKSMPKNEQLSAYADEISLEEGLFGWLSGVFKNPGLKRKVRKLKDELVRTRIELGNLKLEGDPIEEFEAELKAKNDKYTTSRNNNRSTNNQNGANAHELRIKTLENSEETIISGMDALSQENEILQKYVDKIKLEARMESNNAIIRAADTHIARVIKKIQIKDKKAIKQMDGEIENLMKQDESYMSYLNESILNEEDSYSDYPEIAKKNAQKAIDWKEKYGRDEVDAGTAVGWARAHQLAKGENISGETVKRMSSFNRHRKNSTIATEYKDTPWKDKGYVSWLIWGGTEGVDWAMKKSKEIDTMKESKQMKHIKPLDIKPLNEAVKYETKGYKVGDKIKTNIAEWEIVETDYKPKETFASPFVFKGKEMEQQPLNVKRTTKGAVGYKVTDGAKYPMFGFLYQYKGNLGSKSLITKLAIMDVDESVVTEKLARGLKPLLTLGSTITKKVGEDALLDLSDKFDRIDDEYAGTIASWLDMAIELMQDGYPGDATKKLKQFNKACKDVLNGKEVGSAFESVVAEGNYNMEDIYDLISHHRFDKDFKKLSTKDKEWVENDAKERGFNESLLESDVANMYYSLIDELYEAKPGPKPYHRGLDDDEIEDKKAQIKKQTDMDDDDSSAYKEMPGDKEARKKGEVKTSKHVKKYHELYGDKKDESEISEKAKPFAFAIADWFNAVEKAGNFKNIGKELKAAGYEFEFEDNKNNPAYKVEHDGATFAIANKKYWGRQHNAIEKKIGDTAIGWVFPNDTYNESIEESVVYNSSNTKPIAAKKAKKEFGHLLPKPNKGIEPYVFAVIKTQARNYRLVIKSGSYVAHEFMTNLKDDGILTAEIVQSAVDNIIKLNPDEFNESVVTENRELMKIDSYLSTKDEEVLIDFLDDAYGNSDDRKTRKEWEDARNDLSYGELVDYAVAHAENFGMDLQDIEDAIEVYEAKKINERKTISSSKISMMGAKILRKISIGTIFDTEDGEYEITDYGRQANAFKEFEAEHNGKQVKVKLTAMYGVTLEVTDDIRSARFNKEVRLNSIILESAVNEAESIKVGKYIKTQYGYFYKRVDGKVGGQEAFVEIKKGKAGKRKTSIHDTVDFEIVDKDVAFESAVNEEKIKYAKGKTYQSSGHWTVMVDSNSSICDIRVNSQAAWRLDPHDDREETWELLDGGRQRATIYFRRGSIDKFAQQMFDLNDRTTWGNKTKLTAKDYADIIRVWIDMKKANESMITEKRYPSFNFGMKKQYNADDINQMYGFWGTLDIHMETEEIEEIWNDVWGILTKNWKFSDAGALYYLNAKAGRWLADKVWNDINSQISQPDAIDMILSDYARPSKWKAWSKEYNEFAQEELAEHVILEKAEGDRGPISDPKIEKALKTKSEETGVPIGIIRIIMRRGMAAWKTGHRPGATEQQWGYARVNAFLTKGAGTWGDADKDVAKEVRDGGHDKGLKS